MGMWYNLNCRIEINVAEVVRDYRYVGYLWIIGLRLMLLKLLVIMDLLVICVEYSC